MKIFGASIRRGKLLDDVVALGNTPVKLEAIHGAEDVVIVVVPDDSQVLVAIHAELFLAREDVKSVDLAHLCVAL